MSYIDHCNCMMLAESQRQAAIAAASSQVAVKAADIAYHREGVRSALEYGANPSQYLVALAELGASATESIQRTDEAPFKLFAGRYEISADGTWSEGGTLTLFNSNNDIQLQLLAPGSTTVELVFDTYSFGANDVTGWTAAAATSTTEV